MKQLPFLLLCAFFLKTQAQPFSMKETEALKRQAGRVTIVKDTWGVPHVYTKTDEQAVFGMGYVQCEEFFDKVEESLITRLGRLSEVQGASALYKDLWARIFIDSVRAKTLLEQSPRWLQQLCRGFAGGINYYIITHPEKKPKLLTRVEPWMCLMNNIPAVAGSNVEEANFAAFYSGKAAPLSAYAPVREWSEQTEADGSNGWALAPSRTRSRHAMLLINPHSEFYDRIEIQLTSKRGLNSYGAPFLGQFNIFQGFNERLGWMHPVSLSDGKDLYAETVQQKDGRYYYSYNGALRPVDSTEITVPYKQGTALLSRKFTVYRTHHGPVVSVLNGKWITLKTLSANTELLAMHWQKMKARNLKQFQAAINRRVMTGNNFVYADRDGNIAYWHGNFVPQKDSSLDWKRPVDGSTAATEWGEAYPLDALPHYINPANGWLQNCNSTVLYATGPFDTAMSRKPPFMFPDGQTPRAVHAIRLLDQLHDATPDDVIAATYDTYLPNAERFIPRLVAAYENKGTEGTSLAEPVAVLKAWDFRTDTASVATTLAVLWMEKLIELNVARLPKPVTNEDRYSVTNGAAVSTGQLTGQQLLDLLQAVIAELNQDHGTWKVRWGRINRFQRNPPGTEASDQRESLAVPATPGYMGSLNAYVSRKSPKTKNRYGVTGNTFVAAVDFGKKLTAKTILTGGASTDPLSPHFTDQVNGYINHQYKEAFFYKKDVMKHMEKRYHPGDRSGSPATASRK